MRKLPSAPIWRAGPRVTPSTSGARIGTCEFLRNAAERLSEARRDLSKAPGIPCSPGAFSLGLSAATCHRRDASGACFLLALSPAGYVNPEPADKEQHEEQHHV